MSLKLALLSRSIARRIAPTLTLTLSLISAPLAQALTFNVT